MWAWLAAFPVTPLPPRVDAGYWFGKQRARLGSASQIDTRRDWTAGTAASLFASVNSPDTKHTSCRVRCRLLSHRRCAYMNSGNSNMTVTFGQSNTPVCPSIPRCDITTTWRELWKLVWPLYSVKLIYRQQCRSVYSHKVTNINCGNFYWPNSVCLYAALRYLHNATFSTLCIYEQGRLEDADTAVLDDWAGQTDGQFMLVHIAQRYADGSRSSR